MNGIIVISRMCTFNTSDLLGNRTTQSITYLTILISLHLTPRTNPAPHLYGDRTKLHAIPRFSHLAIQSAREEKSRELSNPRSTQSIQSLPQT
jgi:hypothetical protein